MPKTKDILVGAAISALGLAALGMILGALRGNAVADRVRTGLN